MFFVVLRIFLVSTEEVYINMSKLFLRNRENFVQIFSFSSSIVRGLDI
jgi:hypothetical protein